MSKIQHSEFERRYLSNSERKELEDKKGKETTLGEFIEND